MTEELFRSGLSETQSNNIAEKEDKLVFDVSDKHLLSRFLSQQQKTKNKKQPLKLLQDLPSKGNIICGENSKGINNFVRKDIKDSGHKFNLEEKLRNAKIKVESDIKDMDITRAGQHFIINNCRPDYLLPSEKSAKENQKRVPTLTIRPPTARRASMLAAIKRRDESGFDDGTINNDIQEAHQIEQSKLVLKVPPVKVPPVKIPPVRVAPVKKESKKERRARVATEIYVCMTRMKEAVDHFKVIIHFIYENF